MSQPTVVHDPACFWHAGGECDLHCRFAESERPSSGEATGGEPTTCRQCGTTLVPGPIDSTYAGSRMCPNDSCIRYAEAVYLLRHIANEMQDCVPWCPACQEMRRTPPPASSVSGTGGGEEPEAAYLARIPESWTAAKARRAAARWWMEADSLRRRLSELEAAAYHWHNAVQDAALHLDERSWPVVKKALDEALHEPSAVGRERFAALADSRRQLQAVRQDATRWQFFRRFLSVEQDTESGGQFLFIDDDSSVSFEATFQPGYEHTVESLVDAAAARLHPQEGASRGG